MAGKNYTSIAKNAPKAPTKDGVDNYKVVGGGPNGGSKGGKKSLPKGKKGKSNPGL
jgi:hypothetical protein